MLQAFQRYWHGDQEEVQFLLDWAEPETRPRQATAAAGSVIVHAVAAAILAVMPAPPRRTTDGPVVRVDLKRATPLVAPRVEEFRLTQKEPAASKPAAEVDLASLLPKPEVRTAPLRPKPGSAPAGALAYVPPRPQTPQTRMVEAPGVDVGGGQLLSPAPVVRIAEPAQAPPPKLAFERVGSPNPGTSGEGGPRRIELPKTSVDEAVRQVAQGGGGRGLIVGDVGAGTGGYSDPLQQQSRSGQNFGTLELLSDPKGVDFRPYLIQVLAAVKRNWQAVIPESARFGRMGRVAIQFAISPTGSVPKLVIASTSGTEALDRAAVAGISMSNPFPPLPREFKGNDIRLQLVFSYNMPK